MFNKYLNSKPVLLGLLVLLFALTWNITFSAIQYGSQVLGDKSVCGGKLDLNCDAVATIADAKTVIDTVTSLKSKTPTPPPATCGNGVCDAGETSKICLTDCRVTEPAPAPSICGNGVCDSGESSKTCPVDCSTTSPTPSPSPEPSPDPDPDPTTPLPSDTSQSYPSAPLCSATVHGNTRFHTLWNVELGCHYDHEHGVNPFGPEIAGLFPGFNLRGLLSNPIDQHVEIGHNNPSSPVENTNKHGGFKWQAGAAPLGCTEGFEDGTVAIDAYAIQYHAFGRQDIELEARQHSSVALLRQCKSSNPADKGYLYVGQLQEYGQRVTPYQGMILPYPNNFQPLYISPRGPYFTTECEGPSTTVLDADGITTRQVGCRDVGDTRNNNNSIWTSKPTQSSGSRVRPETPRLFRLLFRLRDAYQRVDVNDLVHPFTWRFVCGGDTYNPVGCRFNNSTTTIHEVMGDIPTSWDNLSGFDSDSRVGRITAEGYVTRYGVLNTSCTAPGGLDCQPFKFVNAFVGTYSSELSSEKVSNPTPQNTPERDIYFCNGVRCSETDSGARPSGWIGPSN